MGKVIINGKAYDSVTGLQIHSAKVVTDIAPAFVPAPKKAEPAPAATPRATTPKKRVSKQARLAAAVAEEFAADETADRSKPKKSTAKKAEQPVTPDNSPAWIANFVEGHAPIEIENINSQNNIRASHSQRHAINHRPKVHLQRSQTLNRRFVSKPQAIEHVQVGRKIAQTPKHPEVQHFAKPQVESLQTKIKVSRPEVSKSETPDRPYVPALSNKVMKNISKKDQTRPNEISSVDLKDFLIKDQMEQPIDRKSRRRAEKAALKFSAQRRFSKTSLVTAALAIIVLGGYFTYVNMPSLSIRVAASRAGVDAASPYTPNGYSLDGPVAYSPGQITIKYKSNSNGQGYSITEQNTDLNTQQAAGSLVQGGTYVITNANGTEVYRYNTNAVWVKDGVLYNLKNNGLLGEDQISKIVESV